MSRLKHLFSLHISLLALCLLCALQATAIGEKPSSAVQMKVQADKFYQAEQYSEALELYTHALEKAQASKDNAIIMACIGNIGNIYGNLDDADLAIYYYKKGLEIAQKENKVDLQLKFATNLVATSCMQGDTRKARQYFKIQMSLPYKSTPVTRYYALCNQSLIAKTEGNYAPALYYQRQALELAIETHLGAAYQITAQMETGNILYLQRKAKEAIEAYDVAYDWIRKSGDKQMEASVCRGLYVAMKHEGNATKAEYYKNRFLALNDSIFDRQRMNAAKAKLFDYENRQNNAIIGRLTVHNRYLIVTSIIFLLLAAAIALLYLKLRQRNRRLLESQQLLVAKNEELLRNGEENRQLRQRYIQAVDRQEEAKVDKETITDSEQEEKESSADDKDGKEPQLSDDQSIRLLEKINSVLDDVSVISREDFSLSMLAQKVGSNTKYVSTVINDTYGRNFKSYLNEFRIREACRRLSDTEHYGNLTIEAIYRELGYKTAAGFIQAFRKINGMTPSQYQKLAREREKEEG